MIHPELSKTGRVVPVLETRDALPILLGDDVAWPNVTQGRELQEALAASLPRHSPLHQCETNGPAVVALVAVGSDAASSQNNFDEDGQRVLQLLIIDALGGGRSRRC